MRNYAVIFIPAWVKDGLSHNKCKNQDILKYKTLKEIMSVEDIVDFLAVQSITLDFFIPQGGSLPVRGCLGQAWENSIGADRTELKTELNSVILSLAGSDDIVKGAKARAFLNLGPCADENTDPLTKPPFVVVDGGMNPYVYVQMADNFLDHMRDDANKLSFVSEVLKVFYRYNSVEEVSGCDFYAAYLSLLSNSKTVY